MKKVKKVGGVALVAAAAVGSYLIAGTYAKYTSEISGYDDADVAKWSWTINNTNISTYADSVKSNAYTFNLLGTIHDSDCSSTESDVDSDLLAPGMCGEFDIDVTNNSEVNATYAIELAESQTNLPTGVTRVPIEYCTAGSSCSTESNWKSTISQANVAAAAIAKDGGTGSVTVKWRWAYQVDANGGQGTPDYSAQDEIDTKIGFAANETDEPNVKVTATVVVVQVD